MPIKPIWFTAVQKQRKNKSSSCFVPGKGVCAQRSQGEKGAYRRRIPAKNVCSCHGSAQHSTARSSTAQHSTARRRRQHRHGRPGRRRGGRNMSSAAGSGGRRGGQVLVSEGPANQMFCCHMCLRHQNADETRVAVRNDANGCGWDHFCRVCSQSEAVLRRQAEWNQHPTVGNRGVSGAVPSSSQTAQSPAGAHGSSNNNSSAAAAAAAEDHGGLGTSPTAVAGDTGAEINDDEAPDEVDATDKDAQRWNNRGLQDAMSRSARSVMRYMPRIAAGGALIPQGMRAGDAGVKSPRAVAAQFRARFPNAPICRPLESVEDRALAAMQLKAATPAMKKRAEEGEDMGYLLREAAMGVFATVHVDVAIFAHELVFFPILVKDERFQVQTENGTAVVMICPGCKSNKFVKPPGVSGHGFPCLSAKLRVAHDIAGVAVPVAGRYACLGPTCPLRMESAKRAAEKANVVIGDDGWDEDTIRKYSPNGASFTTMDDRYMQLLPEEIVEKFPYRFFKQNGTSERLLDVVRATKGDLQSAHRMLVAGDQGQEIRDMGRYFRFVGVQQEMERKAGREPTLWPGWKFKRGTIAATPSVTVLNTIYSAGHGAKPRR
ncbi:unnamed protein product [Pylaiella littoralis]